MSELTSLPQDSEASGVKALSASIERLSSKISLIQDAVKNLAQERALQENKIEDAQKRIQHILSRLPEQSDGRQLNLLGEAVAPNNPEDDNEPTTH
jgi:predicted  nucleic acid-binding Zn-ribbon protein